MNDLILIVATVAQIVWMNALAIGLFLAVLAVVWILKILQGAARHDAEGCQFRPAAPIPFRKSTF